MLNRIQVTTVFVSDLDKAREFYSKKLGLDIKFDMPTPAGHWLEVVPKGAETSLALQTPWPGMSLRPGPTGMIFDTSDCKGAVATLKKNGVKLTQEPTAQAWGGIEARFADPDGNEFSLVQRTGMPG